jgi:hypothetical protein
MEKRYNLTKTVLQDSYGTPVQKPVPTENKRYPVQTSGMDVLTPLPSYLKYSYPDYWKNYVPPNVYYDIPFYGPIAKPWGIGSSVSGFNMTK